MEQQRRKEARYGLIAQDLVLEIRGDYLQGEENPNSPTVEIKTKGMVNISNAGMFIPVDFGDKILSRDTPVKITWNDPPRFGEGMEILSVNGFVRHCKVGYGIGIEFAAIPKELGDKLGEWTDFLSAGPYDGGAWPPPLLKEAIDACAIIVTSLGVFLGLWGILTVDTHPDRAGWLMGAMLTSIVLYAALRLLSSFGAIAASLRMKKGRLDTSS